MKTLFLQILDMSASAAILAVVVMVLRLLLKKAPKAIHCVLWGMVALRLVCPILPESSISLMPNTHSVSSAVQPEPEKAPVTSVQPPAQEPQRPIVQQPAPQESAPQEPVIQVPASQPDEQESNMTVTDQPEQKTDWIGTFSIVWLSGMGAMALYGVGSFLILRRKVAPAVKEDGVWMCDHVASPFILGIFRPRIYLPSDLETEYRASVLAHENAHLRRKDHWWKPLGFVLLAIHWFNPVMWVSYILLCRDIEAACDERVVKAMEPQERKAYSEALLSCAAPRRSIAVCPLAFGEQNTKSRIKSVLSYKKPTIWIILAALVVSAFVGVFFLTNPKEKDTPTQETEATEGKPDILDDPQVPNEPDDLFEKVPSYYELGTFKGIEVYVWEEDGELRCGAMGGTNRIKEKEEIEALTGIQLEEMAVILDTYSIPDWYISIHPFGETQYWTEEQAQDRQQWRKIANQLRPRLGLYVRGDDEVTGDYTVATKDDIQPVFGDGFFYAKGYDGLYRVYCSDMEGLSEGDRLSISFVDKQYLAGIINHQITAKKIFNYSTDKSAAYLVMTMSIEHTRPSCSAFEVTCFYASDNDGKFYRVYCNDMSGLYEGQAIRVTYNSSSLRELEYPGGYPDGGYTPKYEITAIAVEDEHGNGQTDYYTTIYYRWDDPLDAVTAEYYAAPVTKEAWELLWNITQKSRAWQDSVTSSSLLYPTMDFVVLQDGSWWPFSISGDQYIVKGQKFSLLTQTEQELLKNLKARAYASLQAREYFPKDYWMVQVPI